MSELYYRKLLRKPKLGLREQAYITKMFLWHSIREWTFFKLSLLFNIVNMITGVRLLFCQTNAESF